jgi:hypothetical protein
VPPTPPDPPEFPGPTPEPPDLSGLPTMPPAQILSNLVTSGSEPLCYSPHPDTGRPCDLTMYHSGNHHCMTAATNTSTGDYYYIDTYWPSETAPGPIPDPNPPGPLPDPVPSPDPGPS